MERWEDVLKEVSDDEVEQEVEMIASDDSEDDNDDGGDDEEMMVVMIMLGNGGDDSKVNIEWSNSDKDESMSEADLDESPLEFEKDGMDEKIVYEMEAGQMVETDFSFDRSQWFKILPPTQILLFRLSKQRKLKTLARSLAGCLTL
ncbi:hypothetical protein L1987_19132 [Smallanthus sonchifolius]|uniref:Uncharacterized protein n=1 Tax=Smallanthus sonchifolius TaxID=185202 RepID=A0ACB9J247_9ASTR|nr:hypothetical protein L1987_19132 [Smallanthus sonchifolius]